MALISVKNDAFNICERIKRINPYYFVVYNTDKKQYEVHNSKQFSNTLCITCDNGLNYSVISKLWKTKIENIDKIIQEIDENNEKIEKDAKNEVLDVANVKVREMFDYAKTKIDDCNFDDSYTTKWV